MKIGVVGRIWNTGENMGTVGEMTMQGAGEVRNIGETY